MHKWMGGEWVEDERVAEQTDEEMMDEQRSRWVGRWLDDTWMLDV